MTTYTEVTRFVAAKDVVIHFKTLETAAKECDAYTFMRAGEGCAICKHGDNGYAIIEKTSPDGVLVIGCSCQAWQFAHDNDGCKHVATYQKRSNKPSAALDDATARDLMAAGWTGGRGDLHPSETTSDEEGEDNAGTDPTPDKAPEHPPVPAPGIAETEEPAKTLYGKCRYCGATFPHTDAEELKKIVDVHEDTCSKRPDDATEQQPHEDKKMEVEETETKTYTHPDGTEFESAEALLDYAEKQNAGQRPAGSTTFDARTFIAPMIKNLGSPRLSEVGGIRIGKKRKGGGAETFDHFIFTTPDKDPVTGDFYIDEAMMELYGNNCRAIPVRFMSDDITDIFTTFYAEYGAGGIKIRGDGENWIVTNPDGSKTHIEDPNNEHGFLNNPNVKPQGILTVLVDGQHSVGTVYRFRTTGWNSIKGMLASLSLCAEISKRAGGRIAFLPMTLVYRTKEVTPKGERYKKTIPVITVEFRGTIEELQQKSKEATTYLGTSGDIPQLVGGVVYDPDAETPEEQEDVRAEFFPDAAVGAV